MSDLESTIDVRTLLMHRVWVQRLAARLLNDSHDAEDVVQRTWLAALTHPPRRLGSVRAWLARVVRNCAQDVGTRRRREQATAEVDPPREERTPEDLVTLAETHRRVVESVLALPDIYRTVILARFFDGQSPSHIGAQLGVPAATVRVRLHRGLQELRDRCRDADPSGWEQSLALLALPPMAHVASGGRPPAVSSGLPWGALAAASLVVLLGGVYFAGSHFPSVALPGGAGALLERRSVADVALEPRRESIDAVGALAGESAGTCVVSVRWHDGKPAVGVGVHCVPWGQAHAVARTIDRVTDGEGCVAFRGLPPGRVGFYGDRGGFVSVTIARGASRSTVLKLPRGILVRGRVIDAKGAGVPHADIVITGYGNRERGQVVGRADVRGRFSLRDVGAQHSVSARARGLAPAPARVVSGSPGDTQKVMLTMVPGGSIRGVLLGPGGAPVVGGRVRVLPTNQAPRVEVDSDAQGRFAVDGMCLGSVAVQVRAGDLAPWSGDVVVSKSQVAMVKIALREGAEVRGIVHSDRGVPLAGVSVQSGAYGSFVGGMVRTDAKGLFVLPGLPDGKVTIWATSREEGRAKRELRLRTGGAVEWNPVLDPGRVVEGIVIDHDGSKPAGRLVSGSLVGSGRVRVQARTDASGRFRLVQCPAGALRLTIFDGRTLVGKVASVRPDGPVLRVRLKPRQDFLGGIRLRVVDHRGNPCVATLTSSNDTVHQVRSVRAAKNGAIHARLVMPRNYALWLQCGALGTLDLGEHEVVGGRVADLGLVRLPQPGAVRVQLMGKAASWSAAQLEVFGVRPWFQRRIDVEDCSKELPLLPGDYTIRVADSGLRPQRFTVRSGEQTVVRLAPPPVRARPVLLHRVIQPTAPAGQTAQRGAMEYEVRNLATGQRKAGRHSFGNFSLRLAAGKYHLEVLTKNGWRGSAEFEMQANAGLQTESPLVVTLRSGWAAVGERVALRVVPRAGQSVQEVELGIRRVVAGWPTTVGRWTLRPDASGTLELRGKLAPGRYAIVVRGAERETSRALLVVHKGKAAELELQLGAR